MDIPTLDADCTNFSVPFHSFPCTIQFDKHLVSPVTDIKKKISPLNMLKYHWQDTWTQKGEYNKI